MALTDKQERFCNEYMIDLNATQAAIRSGYSENSAGQIGEQNLKKLDIQSRLAELQSEISKRNNISIDELVGILSNIARFDIADLYDEKDNLKSIHDIPRESREAIEELTVFEEYSGTGANKEFLGYTRKVKSSGKQSAIDKLLKHLGGYEKDNSQKTISTTVNIDISKLTNEELELYERIHNKTNPSS